jgi:hypothetical protein
VGANYPTSTAANGIWSLREVRNNAIGATWPGYFRPTQIANCTLWLDAADWAALAQNSNGMTAAAANNDPVGYWQDKSASAANATQTTNANRPILKTNAVLGRPAVEFNGSSTHLRSAVSFSSTHSLFFVANPRVGKIGAMIGGNDTADWDLVYGDASSFGNSKFAAYGNGRAVYGDGALSYGSFQVLSAVLSGGTLPGNLSMWKNGTGGAVTTETAGVAPGATLLANVWIGRTSAAASQGWDGQIAEIIGYSRAVTTTERQTVERYLGWKWGVTVA